MKKWMTILASLLLLSGCGAKEDTFSLSAAEQEAYEESIDKVTEDFYWEYERQDRMPYWRRRRCCTITAMRQGHCNAGL